MCPIESECRQQVLLALDVMCDEERYLAFRILSMEKYSAKAITFWMDTFLERIDTFRNCYSIDYGVKHWECFRLGNLNFLVIKDAVDTYDAWIKSEEVNHGS